MEYITMQEAWDQIEAIPGYARKKSSLLKVREFLGLLGEPDREFQVIHVAGTNGKGFRLRIPHLHDPGSKKFPAGHSCPPILWISGSGSL